ncbi:MAG TPA: hypothetical protein VGL97_09930 [Bryobacteraceae bacterium]|jgi:hypothetical protein
MSDFDVSYAVYGGLHDGNQKIVYAFDVASVLSSVLNAPGATGIVQCGNKIFGDPLLDYQKHFGALVNNRYFACEEGQTIDFYHGGGAPASGQAGTSSNLVVKFAVYGALDEGDESFAQAFDVTARLQAIVNAIGGVVACDNASFGDPSVENKKHFAAVVNRGGTDFYFACEEGQAIDFANAWVVNQ